MAATKFRYALLCTAAMATCYAISSMPSALHQDKLGTALANTSGYVVYVVVIRFVWEYMKKVARQSDKAWATAQRAARRADASRIRASQLAAVAAARKDAHIHTQSGMLSYLAQMEILASDPELSAKLRTELLTMSRQGRSVLGDAHESATGQVTNLHTLLTGVIAEFAGVDVVNNTHCARDVELAADASIAVADAVRTLLWNVRNHADATQVTVFAESEVNPPTRWTLSVRDNGSGFDPTSEHIDSRFGLKHQVHRILRLFGITAVVESSPGKGTTVTLSGDTTATDTASASEA